MNTSQDDLYIALERAMTDVQGQASCGDWDVRADHRRDITYVVRNRQCLVVEGVRHPQKWHAFELERTHDILKPP